MKNICQKILKHSILFTFLFTFLFISTKQIKAQDTCYITTRYLRSDRNSITYDVTITLDEEANYISLNRPDGSSELLETDSTKRSLRKTIAVDSSSSEFDWEVISTDTGNTICSAAYIKPDQNEEDEERTSGQADKGQISSDISKSGPTDADFNAFNPLNQFSQGEAAEEFFANDKVTPASFIKRTLNFLFPLSGMILFIMIVWGGFEMLSTAATKKSMDAGKQRITAAIVGFFLLFTAYWIMQILEAVFGIKIL
ncbi:MAG: pilin [Patescibacteria group bacterium]